MLIALQIATDIACHVVPGDGANILLLFFMPHHRDCARGRGFGCSGCQNHVGEIFALFSLNGASAAVVNGCLVISVRWSVAGLPVGHGQSAKPGKINHHKLIIEEESIADVGICLACWGVNGCPGCGLFGQYYSD